MFVQNTYSIQPGIIGQRSLYSRTVELYVDDLTGSVTPKPGHDLQATNKYPGPTTRETSIAYSEKFGLQSGGVETTTSYRIFIHEGRGTVDSVAYHVKSASGKPLNPDDIIAYPEPMFVVGETITWNDPSTPGTTSTGRVRKVNEYPHGANLRIIAFLNTYKANIGAELVDQLAGVYVRFRCDRIDLSRI